MASTQRTVRGDGAAACPGVPAGAEHSRSRHGFVIGVRAATLVLGAEPATGPPVPTGGAGS